MYVAVVAVAERALPLPHVCEFLVSQTCVLVSGVNSLYTYMYNRLAVSEVKRTRSWLSPLLAVYTRAPSIQTGLQGKISSQRTHTHFCKKKKVLPLLRTHLTGICVCAHECGFFLKREDFHMSGLVVF
jgi:hypothetical protein